MSWTCTMLLLKIPTIDHNDNWAHLQYEEGYYIKAMSPEINIKKASKEFQLFK